MRTRRLTCWLTAVLGMTGALGDNFIREWSGRDPNTEFTVLQVPGTIVLQAGGIFKFQATDPNGQNGLGIINEITVAANVNEQVDLYIQRDPNEGEGPGANSVYGPVNLTGGIAAGNLKYVNVAFDLGSWQYGTLADKAETIIVGGNLYNLGHYLLGLDITGPVTVTGLLAGDVFCTTMKDFSVLGGATEGCTIQMAARTATTCTSTARSTNCTSATPIQRDFDEIWGHFDTLLISERLTRIHCADR